MDNHILTMNVNQIIEIRHVWHMTAAWLIVAGLILHRSIMEYSDQAYLQINRTLQSEYKGRYLDNLHVHSDTWLLSWEDICIWK